MQVLTLGTCWTHCGHRQQVTPMCSVGKFWIPWKCTHKCVFNFPRGHVDWIWNVPSDMTLMYSIWWAGHILDSGQSHWTSMEHSKHLGHRVTYPPGKWWVFVGFVLNLSNYYPPGKCWVNFDFAQHFVHTLPSGLFGQVNHKTKIDKNDKISNMYLANQAHERKHCEFAQQTHCLLRHMVRGERFSVLMESVPL